MVTTDNSKTVKKTGKFFTDKEAFTAFEKNFYQQELKKIPGKLAKKISQKDMGNFIVFPFFPRFLPKEFLMDYKENLVNRWIMLRYKPINQTLNKPWREQKEIIPKDEKVSSPLVIAYALILMINRDINILRQIGNYHFRTNTICPYKSKRIAVKTKIYRLEPHFYSIADEVAGHNLGIITEKTF